MRAICRRCDAEILWGITAKGKRMPIDLEPRPDGNLAVYRDPNAQLRVRVLEAGLKPEPYERPGMPHFATCPGVMPKEPRPEVPSLATERANRRRRDFASKRDLA